MKDLATLTAENQELLSSLEEITDHFVGVMGGPIMSNHVQWEDGVENIPTIARARRVIARVKAGQR